MKGEKMRNRLLVKRIAIAFFVMLAFAVLVTWRLFLGMQDKQYYNETTLIAEIPVWWGYAASLVGASGFALVAAVCVWRSVRRVVGQAA
jgi:TRAP-type C4-dicarboxylate transport system permease small subunit